MYDLPYFKDQDKEVILRFIGDHPFAFLTGCNRDNQPVATQVPVFIEDRKGKLFLTGHIMKGTDHHKAFEHNPNVLAVFTAPNAYVSATWYSDPQQASTWNYMSVHARGVIRFGDEQALIDILRKTTLHFEGGNTASATVFDNLPEDYTHKLMKAIVAFAVEVESIEHVFKLSQNRDKESYTAIAEKLKEQGGGGAFIAAEMEHRAAQLFGEGTDKKGCQVLPK